MSSLFVCPLCGGALTRREGSYLCPAGHCFDIAREGYTYLLPVNRKHSKTPGDDKAMAAARHAFLEKGYYAPAMRRIMSTRCRTDRRCPGGAGQRLRRGLLHRGHLSCPV